MAFWKSRAESRSDMNKDTSRSTPPVNLQTVPTFKDTELTPSPVSSNSQVKHLNGYINELVKENERLQNMIDDCKTSNMLNKQMLNEYANTINEQSEEITQLKSEKTALEEEIKQYQQKVRRRNDAQADDRKILSERKSDRDSHMERFSQILNSTSMNFEQKQLDLIKELNSLKVEMQGFAQSSDDEPELTQKRSSKVDSKEVLSCLIDSSDQEETEHRLQQLLDNSVNSNQRIMFADKNNQIWEIVKQKDILVDSEPTPEEE